METLQATDRALPFTCLEDAAYARNMAARVEPYLAARRKSGFFEREPGRPLYYESFLPDGAPRGTVVICHGLNENCEKFCEPIYYFLQAGYEVWMPEHRGHGRSWRAVADPSLTHIDRFDTYVQDFAGFVQNCVLQSAATVRPLFLYAHSMGGAIGTAVLEQHPGLFARAVLNAPMLSMRNGAMPNWLCWLISAVMLLVGKGQDYAAGQTPFDPHRGLDEYVCDEPNRFLYYQAKCAKNPALQNHGVSYRWGKACLDGSRRVRSAKNEAKVAIPVLLFSAGKDLYVRNDAHAAFAARRPNVRQVFVPDGQHELYLADRKALTAYWQTLLDFLAQ